MTVPIEAAVCAPIEGNVYPGTWPDCPDCHGNGCKSKAEPLVPCPTCQARSAAIDRSLSDLIEFDYYSRPRNNVPFFYRDGEEVQSPWKDITWAEVFDGIGVQAGTWPDCSRCLALGSVRRTTSWDGHRSDSDWCACGVCQTKTKQSHQEHPNEKDLLMRKHADKLKETLRRHQAELAEMKQAYQAELDALPY